MGGWLQLDCSRLSLLTWKKVRAILHFFVTNWTRLVVVQLPPKISYGVYLRLEGFEMTDQLPGCHSEQERGIFFPHGKPHVQSN